jgi:hypothetical protein
MEIILKLATFGAAAVVLGYFLVLVLMMLWGRINMHGLLSDESGQRSPARLLAMITSITIAGGYLAKVATTPGGHFPEIPIEALLVLAGGNGYYLAAKGSLYRPRRST